MLLRRQGRPQGLIAATPDTMRRTLLLLASMAMAASVQAAEPGVSLVGSGLITLPSTETLAAGHGTLGVGVDVKDRDPLSLDIAEYPALFALGLGRRFEIFGQVIVSSVVAVPEAPVLPPPPLDIIVRPGASAPAPPYYALYSPAPYVNKRSPDRFERFIPGDATIGGKLRLREADGWVPALAASGEIAFPVTRSLHKLQESAGTGTFDLSGRLTAEWAIGRTALVATASYVRVGPPHFGDRTIVAQARPTVTDQPLRLPSRADLGIGVREPLSRRLAAIAEASTSLETGGHTPTVYGARPLDLIAGFQFRARHAWLNAAARYQAHIPSKDAYPSPLAGALDLTDVAAPELAAYLTAIGTGSSVGSLRPGTQRIVLTPLPGVALPTGARVIPSTYHIRADGLDKLHGLDFTVSFGWAF